MAVPYEYRCEDCNRSQVSYWRGNSLPCVVCALPTKRVWKFNARLSMPDHYNHAVGAYVSNEAALTEQFHVQSEAATERTGIPHKFVPVHPSDKETFGVTDEGLDATHDRNVQSGKIEPTRKLR